MKKTIYTLLLVGAVVASCKNNKTDKDHKHDSTHMDSSANAKHEEMPEAEVDQATQEKNRMEYATPGAPHQMMQSWDGEWNARVITYMGPQADTTMGKTVNKTIMGGRYQVSNFSGTMMGQPFEGMSTLAFDNHKKMFISSWIDNMGTGLMVSEGPWDEATKTITLTGKMMSGGTGKMEDFKQTMRIVDDNTQVSELYGNNGNKWMEITYTRKNKR